MTLYAQKYLVSCGGKQIITYTTLWVILCTTFRSKSHNFLSLEAVSYAVCKAALFEPRCMQSKNSGLKVTFRFSKKFHSASPLVNPIFWGSIKVQTTVIDYENVFELL